MNLYSLIEKKPSIKAQTRRRGCKTIKDTIFLRSWAWLSDIIATVVVTSSKYCENSNSSIVYQSGTVKNVTLTV